MAVNAGDKYLVALCGESQEIPYRRPSHISEGHTKT
jgi:hypothetical protein